MVVPVDPFEGGELDRFEAPPGIAPDDEFGLDPPMMDSARACLRLDRGGVFTGVSYPAETARKRNF